MYKGLLLLLSGLIISTPLFADSHSRLVKDFTPRKFCSKYKKLYLKTNLVPIVCSSTQIFPLSLENATSPKGPSDLEALKVQCNTEAASCGEDFKEQLATWFESKACSAPKNSKAGQKVKKGLKSCKASEALVNKCIKDFDEKTKNIAPDQICSAVAESIVNKSYNNPDAHKNDDPMNTVPSCEHLKKQCPGFLFSVDDNKK